MRKSDRRRIFSGLGYLIVSALLFYLTYVGFESGKLAARGISKAVDEQPLEFNITLVLYIGIALLLLFFSLTEFYKLLKTKLSNRQK